MQNMNQIEPVIGVISKLLESNLIIQITMPILIASILTRIGMSIIKSILRGVSINDYNFDEYVSENESKDHIDDIDNFDDLDEIEEEYLIELKCKNCNGHLEIKNNYFECKYCDTKYIRKE